MSTALQSAKIIILGVVLAVGVSIVSATWKPPTAAPPAGNTPAPVNVGTALQTKAGGLWVEGGLGIKTEKNFCIGLVCANWEGASSGQVLKFDGTKWVPGTDVAGGGGGGLTGSGVAGTLAQWSPSTGDLSGTNIYYGFGPSVGIGIPSPTAALDVLGGVRSTNEDDAGFWLKNTGVNGRYWRLNATSNSSPLNGALGIEDITAGVWRMVISPSGYVGIGTINPLRPLHVANNGIMRLDGGSTAYMELYKNGDATRDGFIGFGSGANSDLTINNSMPGGDVRILADGSETARFFNGTRAQVAIGTTASSGYSLRVVRPDSNGATIGISDLSGEICSLSPGAGASWSCPSDERLKKNIEPLDYGLDIVTALRPVSFNMKSEKDTDPKTTGFIAQEVQKILPRLVTEEQSTGYLSLEDGRMIPYLVKAIQEQDAKIKKLEQDVVLMKAGH